MSLVCYSNSSESENEENLEDTANCNKSVIRNIERKNLPQASMLLGESKASVEVIDEPSLHEGRVRGFKHERGNWATYVFVPISGDLLEDLQESCLTQISKLTDFKTCAEFHISLSKTIVLQYHLIDAFVECLEGAIQNCQSFPVALNQLMVYTNSERSRTFLAVKIEDLYMMKMTELLSHVNRVMLDFKLDTFYKDPSFHISFLWCLGDQVKLIESHLPQLVNALKDCLCIKIEIQNINCKSGYKEFTFKLKN
uniref:U6 snRNA phosphodiesterase n=1 Tax=Glossina austeni TaxID=7395 RepID=A0A1A9VPK2_GLOAU